MVTEVEAFRRQLWRARRRGNKRLQRQHRRLRRRAARWELTSRQRVRFRAIQTVLRERGLA